MPPRRSMKRMVGTPLAANPEQSQIALRHGGTSQMTKVPAWRQEVTDEQGRRRLHGAFKGGYSAGYYNTVGSKEGWQPATFESSRTTRAAAAGNDQKNTTMQRALELMDDEDLEDAADGKQLRAVRPAGSAAVPGTAASTTITASTSSSSLGYRLLRKLGLPVTSTSSAVTVPPVPTTARLGLGAVDPSASRPRVVTAATGSGRTRPDHDDPVAAKLRGQSTALSIRGGFGTGILNDQDDDDHCADLDVYGDNGEEIELLPELTRGKVRRQHRQRQAAVPPPGPSLAQASDGVRVPRGFVVGMRGVQLERTWPAVPVPPNWEPSSSKPLAATGHGSGHGIVGSKMDAAKVPRPGSVPPSLFPFLPPPPPPPGMGSMPPPPPGLGSMLRMPPGMLPPPPPPPQLIGGRLVLPPPPPPPPSSSKGASLGKAAPPPPPPPPAPPGYQLQKAIPADVAQAALDSLRRPFTGSKADRYAAYLASCAGHSASVPMLLLAEQSEFASTAALFRPMAAMLEARFTRAADAAPSSSADPSPADTVAAPIPTGPAPLSIPPLAAPRDSTDWYPEKLLCKRFGVPMPHGGRRGPVDENDMNDPLGGSGVDRLLSDATMREIIEGAGGAGGHHFNPRPESTSGGTDGGESGQLLQLTFAIDRPPQEVFDRIFGDPVAALLLSTAPPALDGDEMDQLPAVDLTATDLTDLAADQVAAALAKHAAMDAWVDTTSTTTGRALPPLPPAQPAVTEYVHTDERDLATAAAGAAGGVVPPLVLFTRRKRTAADMVTTTESTAGSDDASTAAGDGRPMASDLSMTDQPTINKRAKKGAAAGATTKKKKGSTNTAMLSFDMDE